MNYNPYQAYKQQSVLTMTQGDMLTMVYDGLLKELTLSEMALHRMSYGEINQHLQKSQILLRHLQSTLDFQYEVSNQLNSLYEYFLHTVVQANIKKDPARLTEIISMITELRDVFVQADRKSRSSEFAG